MSKRKRPPADSQRVVIPPIDRELREFMRKTPELPLSSRLADQPEIQKLREIMRQSAVERAAELDRKRRLEELQTQWLEQQLSQGPAEEPQPDTPEEVKPHWDVDRSTLSLNGTVIRSISRRAKNPIKILNSFQELGWPYRIDDPLDRRYFDLSEAIRTLNTGLERIRFNGDGTGKGIVWEMK